MPSDRPSLAASLRKPTPEELKEAFLRGEQPQSGAAVADEPAPEVARGRKSAGRRLHATFSMKARTHSRLKKLAALLGCSMVDIIEDALEPRMAALIEEHGLSEVFVKLDRMGSE